MLFFLLPDQGTELSPELFAPARRLRHLTGSRFIMQGAGQSHRNRHLDLESELCSVPVWTCLFMS